MGTVNSAEPRSETPSSCDPFSHISPKLAVFAPLDADIMYPEGFGTYVDCLAADGTVEGKSRPGHFRGVATVCTKLFNIVMPNAVFFGQKDGMQCMLIAKLLRDLDIQYPQFNITDSSRSSKGFVVVDTEREEDGLAMSSRNRYLTVEERSAATLLYHALSSIRDEIFDEVGARADCQDGLSVSDPYPSWQKLRKLGVGIIQEASGPDKTADLFDLEYLVATDYLNGEELQHVNLQALQRGVMLSLAVRTSMSNTRLIDNVVLMPGSTQSVC